MAAVENAGAPGASSTAPIGGEAPAAPNAADRGPLGERAGRLPVGLMVSVLGHLAAAILVTVTLFSERQPIEADAVAVELVRTDPSAEKEKPKGEAGEKAGATASQAPPSQPTPPPSEAHAAPSAAASPPPDPAGDSAIPPSVEPFELPPQLVPDALDSVGRAASGRETTLTQDEAESLRDQVMRCWEIPGGWTNPRQVTVTVRFRLGRDGALQGKPVVVEGPASRLGKAAADNAVRALTKCGPYHMPPEKYDEWRDVQLRLAPPQ